VSDTGVFNYDLMQPNSLR